VAIEFRDLTPERAEDLLGFFEGPAFADNPHWASCYCFFYHFADPGDEWSKRTADASRRAKADLVRGRCRCSGWPATRSASPPAPLSR